MKESMRRMTAGTTVQVTSRAVLPCEYTAFRPSRWRYMKRKATITTVTMIRAAAVM